MPDANDGLSAAVDPTPERAALRRCPGCHNQVTARTPVCPICGKHATVARLASVARWTLIVIAAAVILWWWCHHG